MSIFETVQLPCPSCAAPVDFQMVLSVNGVRAPELREAILKRSFQREHCKACGTEFRMAPEFSYLDTNRKQYFGVWPASERANWKALEAKLSGSFDRAFGPGSGAQGIGRGMKVRLVLGWSALNEKLLAESIGVDDATLEMAKVAALRRLGEFRISDDQECRLIGGDEERLSFGWVSTASEALVDEFSVPRQIVADIEAEPDTWGPLREAVASGLYVDYHRAFGPEAEAGVAA